eukprot:NODE_1070_length_1026_cov_102.238042_g1025_i0.p1 GENE.NODE_1070_length_1026_cov_102.238042_g1025_i0~~NODE_1070_length_1026_cov_102.238042_g1025_i0.p1  ORF type:complete len:301 (+),score=88.32 NODE_1070_length_1026_cov_102.238042_g1025_i0:75-977(+)
MSIADVLEGERVEIGIIGGTGVYAVEGIEDVKQVEVDTPFGQPSAPIVIGTISGVRCAFLARHGHGHKLIPTEVPYRANIFAMKKLGVKYLITFSACGSLKEELHPKDIVLVDQFIDRTKHRQDTFYGDGIVVHVGFGEPTSAKLRGVMQKSIAKAVPEVSLTLGGTYVCMEGPAFSTKAESNMHRGWGASVIGMTALSEAKLAREAEIAYVCTALVTDYDCWKEEEHVTADAVIQVLKSNGDNVQKIVKEAVTLLAADKFEDPAHGCLKDGLMTPAANITEEKKRAMQPLLGKYVPPSQ